MKNNIYKFKIFNDKEVIHGISQRSFGSMMNKKILNKKNLKRFLENLGVLEKDIFFLNQIHSPRIVMADNPDFKNMSEGDGFITGKKGKLLAIVTADCLPIIFYEKKKKIIGVAHAGYKGIYKGIVKEMMNKFRGMEGNTKNIQIAVGPSIGVCCYDVFIERKKIFEDKFGVDFVKNNRGRYYLDLKKIAFRLFVSEGIKKENIEISKICTRCNRDKFFSYRGDKKDNYGEFVTVAGLI